ncbi:MAG TPA: tetratricopeptide repeat protein [Phycisphaerae bacterium]|nr:tetratricopeptide repeat protein [Phycisphaerae bacterium]
MRTQPILKQTVLGLILPLAVLTAYLPAIRGGFVWDDEHYVTDNAALRSLDGLRAIWLKPRATPQYYPLVHTSYWLEYRLWGLKPLGYHLVNVLLHAASAILLWRLLRRLDMPGAWLAAALFALHPVHVESVAWITERKNTLSTAFYLFAALAYVRFARIDHGPPDAPRRWGWYPPALILFLCALLSKTVTCSFPAAVLLVIGYKRGRIRLADLTPLIPFFVLGLVLGLNTAWLEEQHVGAQGQEWALSFVDRGLIAARALWFYLGKLAWPAHLTFTYPRWHIESSVWWQYLYPAAALALVTSLWLLRRRLGPGPLVAALFFGGTLLPALGFVDVYPMRFSFVADHFQYLASIGPITLFAAALTGLARSAQKRIDVSHSRSPSRLALAACQLAAPCLILIVLATLTWRQSRSYKDLETLWRDTLAKNPSAWMAHYNLGNLLSARGDTGDAIVHYRRAAQIKPDFAEGHYNLGVALRSTGRLSEAIEQYRKALQIDPRHADAHNNLGAVLGEQGMHEEAIGHLTAALKIKPDDVVTHSNLASVLLRVGRADKAVQIYRAALVISPNDHGLHADLAGALDRLGAFEEAVEQYELSLRIAPDSIQTRLDLAVLLLRYRRAEQATRQYQVILQVEQENAAARNGLGLALAAQGKFPQAIEQYQRVLQVHPDHVGAHHNLANALVQIGRVEEAVHHYQQALRIMPDQPTVLDNLAWLLATCPEPEVRDGTRAVALAERACGLVDPTPPQMLDTLAAAYAENGLFDQAVDAATRAIERAESLGQSALSSQVRARLRLYQERRPFHEHPASNTP